MKDLNEGEAKKYLIAEVESRGYTVTSDQLTRWHRKGLLPRPELDHLGRHGSKTVYPIGTIERVIEICRVHEQERRLDYVAWQLWWSGVEVNLGTIRNFMRRSVKEWDKFRREYSRL